MFACFRLTNAFLVWKFWFSFVHWNLAHPVYRESYDWLESHNILVRILHHGLKKFVPYVCMQGFRARIWMYLTDVCNRCRRITSRSNDLVVRFSYNLLMHQVNEWMKAPTSEHSVNVSKSFFSVEGFMNWISIKDKRHYALNPLFNVCALGVREAGRDPSKFKNRDFRMAVKIWIL